MEVSKINSGFLPSFFRGFDDSFLNPSTNFSKILVNISERENDYQVELAAPGYKKEDIHIELDGYKLIIKGEVKENKEIKEENYTHKEFSYGEFMRSFTLPKEIDLQNIAADYNNGVLKINIPKQQVQKKIAKRIEVK